MSKLFGNLSISSVGRQLHGSSICDSDHRCMVRGILHDDEQLEGLNMKAETTSEPRITEVTMHRARIRCMYGKGSGDAVEWNHKHLD